jgi:spermidine synthase
MNGRKLFGLALLLAATSGCAALAHELLWTRRLVDLLGAGSASSTRVFGCFFLGLSLGAVWAASRIDGLKRPFRAVAAAEAGVALLALPVWTLPAWTAWIWPALGPEGLTGAAGTSIRLVLSLVTITAPSFLMGAVLPFLGAAVLRGDRSLGRHGIWLYAVNTLGGVAGLVLVISVGLDALGASGSMLAAISLNLLVALGAWRLDLSVGEQGAEGRAGLGGQRAEERTGTARAKREAARQLRHDAVRGTAMWVSFVSGFGVLSLEVLCLAMVTLRAPLSYQATSAVLITVILLLAVASLVVPSMVAAAVRPRSLVITALSLTGMVAVFTPALFAQFAFDPAWESPASSVLLFALSLTVLALITLGPMVLLAGMVFPATLAWLGDDGGDQRGRRWGWLLAVNGFGGVLGAEFAYRVLMPTIGVYPGIAVIGVLYVIAAFGVTVTSARTSTAPLRPAVRWMPAVAAVVIMAGALANSGYGVFSALPDGVLYQRSGREGTVVVLDNPRMGRAILVNNRYLLGTSSGRWDEERQVHIPFALHPAPRDFVHIGSGTGITPGAALDYPTIETAIALELSAPVRDAAREFFAEYNHGITDSDRGEVIVEDGRTYLASTEEAFDVITGDAFLPWAGGVGRLYSREHFLGVRRALRPGGVFCQWLPMHQLTEEQFEIIADTFATVFDDVHLFRNTFYLRAPGIALVGFKDGELDWEAVAERTAESRSDGLKDPAARQRDVLAMLYLGRYPRPAENRSVNTLGNLALELSAARERVTGDIPGKYMIGTRWLTWLRLRLADETAFDAVPVDVIEKARLGLLASEHERLRASRSRSTATSAKALSDQLPASIRSDEAIDPRRWPGDASVLRQ